MKNEIKKGKVILEISSPSPEKILNILWSKNIKLAKVVRINITTIRIEIRYEDYDAVKEVTKKCNGKIVIVSESGLIFILKGIKKQLSLIIGIIAFVIVMYALSNHIWSIEINTKENISPYEIRKELKSIGVIGGISKKDLNVYSLEKKLENLNSDILWIRARIEGSTLKIVIREKVTPPTISEKPTGDCTATMDGEVKRVYVNSGTAKVTPGDFVKVGDTLISSIVGREGDEYESYAKGTIIANTFYEKEMEVQISGKKMERTGRKDNDIYLNIFGKKIYLKKVINTFPDYDKIENNNRILNENIYFERGEKDVNINRDEAVNESEKKLEESLLKSLSNEAKIVDKNVQVADVDENRVRIKVMFVVEQNIAINR